jgi:hypothetical protein
MRQNHGEDAAEGRLGEGSQAETARRKFRSMNAQEGRIKMAVQNAEGAAQKPQKTK